MHHGSYNVSVDCPGGASPIVKGESLMIEFETEGTHARARARAHTHTHTERRRERLQYVFARVNIQNECARCIADWEAE